MYDDQQCMMVQEWCMGDYRYLTLRGTSYMTRSRMAMETVRNILWEAVAANRKGKAFYQSYLQPKQ